MKKAGIIFLTILISHTTIASGITTVAFPLRLGIEVHPWERISIGLVSGFYGVPPHSIVGFHVGPVISFIL